MIRVQSDFRMAFIEDGVPLAEGCRALQYSCRLYELLDR